MTTQFVTALDDSPRDVGFSISSAGKTSQQSDWFESDEGYQVMLPGTGGQTTRTCAKDSNGQRLEGNLGVYWVWPGSATESTDGAPLCTKSEWQGWFRPTDRTRLNEMRAVKNPVCDTPKASNVNAERIEQASQKVEKRSRTSRSWFEGVSVECACKVMPDTVRNCAWQINTPPCEARQSKAERGVASTQRTSVKVHQDESFHGWRVEPEFQVDTGEVR